MKSETNSSKKQKNLKSNNNNKIILNKKEDLNKISFTQLKNAKIFDFSGDYFDWIYQKALNIEHNPEEKESLMTFNSTEKEDIKKNITKKKRKINKEKEYTNNTKNNIINNNVYFNQENYNIYNNGYKNTNKTKSEADKKEFKINKIIFQMTFNTRPGEDLGVIGSISEIGSWDQNKALRMNWNDGNVWKANINYDFSKEKEFEYKFIFIENGRVKKWEDGNNRKLEFSKLKDLIESNIKEEYYIEFKNINGMDFIYNHKENTLIVVCSWNVK